jgi:hypothetical protein
MQPVYISEIIAPAVKVGGKIYDGCGRVWHDFEWECGGEGNFVEAVGNWNMCLPTRDDLSMMDLRESFCPITLPQPPFETLLSSRFTPRIIATV